MRNPVNAALVGGAAVLLATSSPVRADEISDLKEVVQKLEARIKALEAELTEAKGKIAGDAELLTRARRAMEIGLALLDEQQKNGRAHG